MKGLEYRWIAALDEVIKQRGFENAAQTLCISQSAVSQRIKQLEKRVAQPVLIRSHPLKATPAGEKLLGLYRQVRLLEQEFWPELIDDAEQKVTSVSIATNADTLATWLVPSLQAVLIDQPIALNLIVVDEAKTLEKLRSGEVVAAISTEPKPIPGCNSESLGVMDYLCVASPRFYKKYFSRGVNRQTLMQAPSVMFDQDDHLHEIFLKEHFNIAIRDTITHTVRSSEAFVKLALHYIAYCLIPKVQITKELEESQLINITPDLRVSEEMYWHHWQLESGVLKALSKNVVEVANELLY